MEGRSEMKKMQNHVTITKRQNAKILWRNQSLLISIGKGKAFRNHRQYQNNNKQDGRPYTFIKLIIDIIYNWQFKQASKSSSWTMKACYQEKMQMQWSAICRFTDLETACLLQYDNCCGKNMHIFIYNPIVRSFDKISYFKPKATKYESW